MTTKTGRDNTAKVDAADTSNSLAAAAAAAAAKAPSEARRERERERISRYQVAVSYSFNPIGSYFTRRPDSYFTRSVSLRPGQLNLFIKLPSPFSSFSFSRVPPQRLFFWHLQSLLHAAFFLPNSSFMNWKLSLYVCLSIHSMLTIVPLALATIRWKSYMLYGVWIFIFQNSLKIFFHPIEIIQWLRLVIKNQISWKASRVTKGLFWWCQRAFF